MSHFDEPKTLREWRVACDFLRAEVGLLRSQVEYLVEAIGRHRRQITNYVGPDEYDEELWSVLDEEDTE